MAEHEATVHRFHRLRDMAAEARAQAIRSEIALGLTLCRIAETELEFGHGDQATKVTERLRKFTGGVHRHLNEPNHVPPKASKQVFAELVELESRILAVEERRQHNC